MPSKLTTLAVERSAFIISAAFTNEDGEAMTPESLSWTLTDQKGNVINDREDVVVATPASSVAIVLSGDDLALQEGEAWRASRLVTLTGTYLSAVTGGVLPFADSVSFAIEDLTVVG